MTDTISLEKWHFAVLLRSIKGLDFPSKDLGFLD